MSALDPFVNVGCSTVAEFVLTPKHYDFDPASSEPEPNPNSNPELVFARTAAPVYVMLNIVCFSLECHEQDCRYLQANFPSNFIAKPIPPYECANAPLLKDPTVFGGSLVTVSWIDQSDNETGFKVERSDNGGAFVEVASLAPDVVVYGDTPPAGFTYCYRVAACSSSGLKTYSEIKCVTL